MATAKNGAWAGFVSKSHDAKKNPLSYNDKIKWIYAIFPFMQGHLVEDPALKTVLQAAAHLYEKGFRSATFVAGEDDMPQMRKLLEDYNGAAGKSHGFYQFEPLTFTESPRLTSATNARQAAQDNDPEAFEIATRVKPNIQVDGKTLFQAVRAGMGLTESIEENFKDHKGPGRPGDAKRHGVPTKASVSTLRKVAKQGGRKGQLAHWMANMKAGKKKASEDVAPVHQDNQQHNKVVDAVVDFYKNNTQIKPVADYPRAAAEILVKTQPDLRDKVKDILVKAKKDPYVQGGVITTIGSLIAGGVLGMGAKYGLTPHQTNIALQAIINTVLPTIISRVNGKDWTETLKYTLASAGIGTAIAAIGEQGKLLDKPTATPEQLAEKYGVNLNVVMVQLAKGIKVESEHTDYEQVAREIALDHLSERLDYYIKLEKVENESYGATNPVSQLADRAVAVMPFDRFAVKVDENYEPNLFEVSMSPGALNDFAKSEVAQTMTIGFEMELAMPDLPEGDGSYSGESETEADMEYNDDFPTGSRWRDDVISWLEGGDNPNYTRDVERTMEWFDEQFFEYADEVFANAVESDEDLQDEIKKEIHDILAVQDKPSDADAIAAEYDEQTDIYAFALSRVQDGWQENKIDDAFDDFCMLSRIRDMEDFLNYVNRNHPRISLHWPYQTYSGGDSDGGDQAEYLQDVANELERKLKRVNSDFYVVVSEDYHDESRELNKFIIEPDGSITPQGREFISPAMQFADGIAAMQVMFEWAQGKGYRTNQSTGFHMGISLPNHETQNIDHMKFILMLGDAHVLEKFNRAKAHYAVNTVNTMRDNLKNGRKVSKEDVAGYLRQMATGMQDLATTELNKLLVPRGEHRQSVNIKNKYMEIRSAGDNYLPRFNDIRLTLLRYLRTLEVSADSQAYRKEYAKKLSKFLTSTEMIRTVDPVTGRKGVASKDSLDATVQHAFDQYFTALQNGESGDRAIAMLTATLNKYKGDKQSQLKGQLKNKQANANPDSAKVKYLGSDRVEYSTKGNANDVINDIINYMREEGMGPMVQRATFLEAPKGQKLIQVKFRYTSSTGRNLSKSYWCFAPDIIQAIAEAKKAWNTGADQPGDMWTASDYSDGESLNAVLYNYTDSDKTPPDDRLNGSLEQTRTRPVTAQDQLYSIRSPDDAGIRTFNAANDAEAIQYARQFFAQNSNYNQDNTVLYRYDNNGTDRDQVSWQPEQPAAEGTSGTFIITYLGPTGNEQQTAYDASSATEAATLFRLQHPSSYQIHQITRLQESVSEAKTPKRPKTIIDGAMKTLINKGRSEDEAIADLKKEIDKKFYSEDQVTFARMQPGETIAEALARARSRLTKS